MNWIILIVVGIIAAGVWYRRLRRRQSIFSVRADAEVEASFYPEIEKCHDISLKTITCSCESFRKERERFRSDDPRRLCKHLVRSFIDVRSLPEDLALYREGIEWYAGDHSGFPADGTKCEGLIAGKRISVIIPGERTGEDAAEGDSLIDVYFESRRYRYSPALQRWAEGTPPSCEEQIIRFLYESAGDPLPEDLPVDGIRTLSRTPAGGSSLLVKGEFSHGAEADAIEAKLKPRSLLIEYWTGGNKGSFHVTKKQHVLPQKRLVFLKAAVEKWLKDEHFGLSEASGNPLAGTGGEVVAAGEPGMIQAVEALLRSVLSETADIALKETRSYIAVTVAGSRRWICRLHLNTRKAGYVAFPDGTRHGLRGLEDLAQYRDQLLRVYSEKALEKGKADLLFGARESGAALSSSVTSIESHRARKKKSLFN
ncbi:MAG: hypothetical protein M1497_04850 [Nitrospirae bacterium]|nr:hypothetical protein [Nitrospirota bacterium]